MGVLLQGFYKVRPNHAVPSPADGDVTIPWWWDHLASQARALRLAGFTAVWLPPVLKTSQGHKPGADGYGPFDDYDIGSKQQQGSVETRFGSREQLQRCVAALRACGIDVYLDMVEHHRSGDTTPFVFRYPGADGARSAGRFPKDPLNFLPQVPHDPNLGGPIADDKPFGRELAPINGKSPPGGGALIDGKTPKHYVMDNLIAAADWLTRALDVQGYRLDDVKGLSSDFLVPFLNSKSMRGKFAVGEFFDGNRVVVEGWVANPGAMGGRSSAFDFPLKFVLNAMCNAPERFDMRSLDHVGLCGIDPLHAVTFVENHDTDLQDDNKIVANKVLGYAYILTAEGYPCVYYRDYSTDVGCYGLKPQIDNLIWIHEKLANGPTQQRFLDPRLFVYERLGGPNLLVGLNSDLRAERVVNVQTAFGPNVQLHDYTGHAPDVFTDGNGAVTITIPPIAIGYVCYSRAGFDGAGFDDVSQPVTQDFEGAPDLDIQPTVNDAPVIVGRVWCGVNAQLRAVLKPDTSAWTNATSIAVDILGPDGVVLVTSTFAANSPPSVAAQTATRSAGFHTLRVTAKGAPASNSKPRYVLSVTFTGDPAFEPTIGASDPAVKGKWEPVFNLSNVAIHAHLLPTGKVLYWGRRKEPANNSFASLNEWETHSFVLDPNTKTSVPTANQPTAKDGRSVNLFCSGHTFLPDGRLMVVGGHLFDSQGHNAATIYDPKSSSWTAAEPMAQGRWYPSAITLADGAVFVCSGSRAEGPPASAPNAPPTTTNNTPEIWSGVWPWKALSDFSDQADRQAFLYPRFHLAPDGRVYMAGAAQDSFFFDTTGQGTWSPGASRQMGAREYAPSVMYDVGKIIYIGGGNSADASRSPTNAVETIDLGANPPHWSRAADMHFPRRQHNATLLPDGTVLVTGGTGGGGGAGGQGFNDLTPGRPVHTAELWNPRTNAWSVMDDEKTDRCYHSVALLLPDGTVLSAGGGEYQPDGRLQPNDPVDSHLDAQIFRPPYLFKGNRPQIGAVPAQMTYGKEFQVQTADAAQIKKASLIGLSSVTHSFNAGQRINFLPVTPGAGAVTLMAPPNANVCPPGPYLLFLLNGAGVPSVGQIVQVTGQPAAPARIAMRMFDPVAKNNEIIASATRPEVVVGLTATCPYGLAACWGGAYAGLRQLSGVDLVRPIADAAASVAYLYLDHDGLPDLAKWPTQFAGSAHGSYVWRGVEVTLSGSIMQANGQLQLSATGSRPAIELVALTRNDKVQLDTENGVDRPLPSGEAEAFGQLSTLVRSAKRVSEWAVTGPIKLTPAGVRLSVRNFRS